MVSVTAAGFPVRVRGADTAPGPQPQSIDPDDDSIPAGISNPAVAS